MLACASVCVSISACEGVVRASVLGRARASLCVGVIVAVWVAVGVQVCACVRGRRDAPLARPAPRLTISDLPEQLQTSIPEISPENGSHVLFEQGFERDRAESSCICASAARHGVFKFPKQS